MGRVVAVVWLFTAAVLIGACVGVSARADGVISDTEQAYILAYGESAICPVINAFPSEAGVMGVLEGIHDDGFAYDAGVDIINASVAQYCPTYWSLLERIGAKARNEIAGVKIA